MLFHLTSILAAFATVSAFTIQKRAEPVGENKTIIHSLSSESENTNVTIYIDSSSWGCQHGDRKCASVNSINSTQLCVAGSWVSYGCPDTHDCIPDNFACSPLDRFSEAKEDNDLPIYSPVAVNVTSNTSESICVEALTELVTFNYDGKCGTPAGDKFEALQYQVTPCLHGSQRCGDGYSELCSYGVWLRSWCESTAQCLSPTFECFEISDIESCISNARRRNPSKIQRPTLPPPASATIPTLPSPTTIMVITATPTPCPPATTTAIVTTTIAPITTTIAPITTTIAPITTTIVAITTTTTTLATTTPFLIATTTNSFPLPTVTNLSGNSYPVRF